MNILFSVWSDLKQRMGTYSHALSILLLYGVGLATMPSTSVAQTHDRMAESDVESILKRMDASLSAVSKRMDAAVAKGSLTPKEGEEKLRQARGDVIWKAALSMDPDQWPKRLQTLILELRPGATIEQFAQWARDKRQRSAENEPEKRIWAAAMAQDPSEWSDRLKAAILELKPNSMLEEIAEGIRHRQRYMQLREQLHAAVEAGEITREEAKQKLEEARSKMGRDANDKSSERLEQLAKKLRAAVEAGEITSEQAKRKLEEARSKIGRDADNKSGERLEQLAKKLRAAVEAGEITREEAKQKLEEARSKMGRDAGQRGGDHLAEFRRGVLERAIAEDPDQWNQRLLEAIARAGWEAEALADRIRAHRARNSEGRATLRDMAQLVEELQLDTSVQTRSWGEIKNEQRD